MPVISTRRDGRRESHRGVGKRLPLRCDGSTAPLGARGAGRGSNMSRVLGVGTCALPATQGSHHWAGVKDSGQRLHYSPRKLLIRPYRLSSRDLPLWIQKLACVFPPLLAEQIFPRGKRQVAPHFLPPDLFLVSVRELILGIPAFYGLASSICIQQFTNMPEGHRNSRWG